MLHYTKPLTAYEYLNILTFHINNNESIELRYGDKISFVDCDELVSDIIVKGLLPKRYGGLESSNVLVITSNNRFDFYQCVNLAKKKYGMDVNEILDHVIITRVFTIYQLAETLIHELFELMEKFQSKLLVIISDLFLLNSVKQQIKQEEKDWIVKQITKSLNNINNSIVTVFSSITIPNFKNHKKPQKRDRK
ncbi:MAG: hypothetical protein WCB31_06400 [Nitrososphaeraceae archaeon]